MLALSADCRLILLGDRASGVGGVHLFAALDDESLWRGDRFVGRDGDRDGEALLEPAQMGALLVEHIERHVGPGAGDEIVGAAAHQLLFERAQHLQRQ